MFVGCRVCAVRSFAGSQLFDENIHVSMYVHSADLDLDICRFSSHRGAACIPLASAAPRCSALHSPLCPPFRFQSAVWHAMLQ